ncbi:MAG: hypothetical protein AAF702_43260 [Chloroflexota bacterium]
MSSKLSLPKSRDVHTLFPKWLMGLSAAVSVLLLVAWAVTMPGLGLTMTTRPLYFPEAPLWHIGLYAGAFVTLSYPIVGLIGTRTDRILAAVHQWLDRMWLGLTGQSKGS